MERIAFTGAEIIGKLSREPVEPAAVAMIQTIITRTVTSMTFLVRDQNYYLYDWHTANIAFRDRVDFRLVLVDWQNNYWKDGAMHRKDMKHRFRTGAAQSLLCIHSLAPE